MMGKEGKQLWTESTLNTKTVKMPVLKKETLEKSGIITKKLWTTLFLSNPKLEFCKDFDLIYNSRSDGLSFNRLANHIIGYKAPIIILVKHTEVPEEDSKSEEDHQDHVIGSYIDVELKDNAKFGGDLNSSIFSLSPDLRTMRTINNKGGTNYAYMNTVKIENSQYPYGIGFGGSTVEFRLWLDGDNIVENSYIIPSDNTYEVGYIIPNKNNHGKLYISKIEIFGLGGAEALEAQTEHRLNLQKMRDKKKKVDKAAFLDSDFDKEFLLGNTYSHVKEKEERGGGC